IIGVSTLLLNEADLLYGTGPDKMKRHTGIYRSLALLLLILSGFPLNGFVRSQEPQDGSAAKVRPRRTQIQSPPGDVEDVLRVETGLVPVDVTVTDKTGRPVRNLRPEDFKLYEDGIERPIAFFNVEREGGETRPVAVVFALDISGSMSFEELDK